MLFVVYALLPVDVTVSTDSFNLAFNCNGLERTHQQRTTPTSNDRRVDSGSNHHHHRLNSNGSNNNNRGHETRQTLVLDYVLTYQDTMSL
jgi:hypothetical protein